MYNTFNQLFPSPDCAAYPGITVRHHRNPQEEIIESESKVLILLGDKPIQWFLSYYDDHWKRLSDFGRDAKRYGQLHRARIGDMEIYVLPLAHPRQIAKLGKSSAVWYEVHERWVDQSANKIANSIKTG